MQQLVQQPVVERGGVPAREVQRERAAPRTAATGSAGTSAPGPAGRAAAPAATLGRGGGSVRSASVTGAPRARNTGATIDSSMCWIMWAPKGRRRTPPARRPSRPRSTSRPTANPRCGRPASGRRGGEPAYAEPVEPRRDDQQAGRQQLEPGLREDRRPAEGGQRVHTAQTRRRLVGTAPRVRNARAGWQDAFRGFRFRAGKSAGTRLPDPTQHGRRRDDRLAVVRADVLLGAVRDVLHDPVRVRRRQLAAGARAPGRRLLRVLHDHPGAVSSVTCQAACSRRRRATSTACAAGTS